MLRRTGGARLWIGVCDWKKIEASHAKRHARIVPSFNVVCGSGTASESALHLWRNGVGLPSHTNGRKKLPGRNGIWVPLLWGDAVCGTLVQSPIASQPTNRHTCAMLQRIRSAAHVVLYGRGSVGNASASSSLHLAQSVRLRAASGLSIRDIDQNVCFNSHEQNTGRHVRRSSKTCSGYVCYHGRTLNLLTGPPRPCRVEEHSLCFH